MDKQETGPDTWVAMDASNDITAQEPMPLDLHWAGRLRDLCHQLRLCGDDRAKKRVCGDIWLLLNAALSRCLRYHSSRLGPLSPDDIKDIASEKSLELLNRIGEDKWDVTHLLPVEVAAYISKVARYGLLDGLKQRRRQSRHPVEGHAGLDECIDDGRMGTGFLETPDLILDRREFARALRKCAEQLESRALAIWFLRVFLAMPSKRIAVHPNVKLKPAHIDVILQRARKAVRECLCRGGYDSADMPPGAFTEMWKVFSGWVGSENLGVVR
ncbi:MAG: sigma-70 family RNA polymerase sigma factor [Acidobacteriota bacterium]